MHCIVSGGGINSQQGKLSWKNGTRLKGDFLFPVKAMSTVYRGKFLQALSQLIKDKKVQLPIDCNQKELFNTLYKKDWIVYAKKPFGGPEQVIDYLGRYTHKVAITNHRIKNIDYQKHIVTFNYKDYADGGKQKQMSMEVSEFIRRFEQHILPKGLTKIRSYGYLANQGRTKRLLSITNLLKLQPHPAKVHTPWQVRLLERYGIQYDQCPGCKQNTLVLKQLMHKIPDDG